VTKDRADLMARILLVAVGLIVYMMASRV